MWGSGLWWIVPAIGAVMCVAFLVMAFFCISRGCGCIRRDEHH
jgi:hypothetical protein